MDEMESWRRSLMEYCEFLRREGFRLLRRLRVAVTREEEKAVFRKFQAFRDRLREAEEQLTTER
jgi:hypothetical protein